MKSLKKFQAILNNITNELDAFYTNAIIIYSTVGLRYKELDSDLWFKLYTNGTLMSVPHQMANGLMPQSGIRESVSL